MDLWEHIKMEEKLQRLRVKWTKAKQNEDWAMMKVIEAQAKALKLSIKKL